MQEEVILLSLFFFFLFPSYYFIHAFIYLHSAMPITHSECPTYLSALFSYQADIRTVNKTHKYNSKLTAQFFIPSGKSYLIHEFHSSKCLNTGRSGCQRAIPDMRGCTVVCFKLSPHQDHVILTNSVRCLITARSSNAYEES